MSRVNRREHFNQANNVAYAEGNEITKDEPNTFEIIGAVTINDAEPLKNTRREIFILLKPSYYIM